MSAAFVLAITVMLALCLLFAPDLARADDLGSDNVVNTEQVPDSSFLFDTTIYDLSNADASYQNKTVQVTGEAVGDSLKSENNEGLYWITLDSTDKDKSGTMSVLVDQSYLSLIDTYGAYDSTGTILRVKGTFHLSCGEHGGVTDIHADTVSMVERGKTYPEVFDIWSFMPGILICIAGIAMAAAFHFLRERQR